MSTERINFTAPEGTKRCIDALASKNHRNRSQQVNAMIEPQLAIARAILKRGPKLKGGK